MWSISKWWNDRQLERLKIEARDARTRYLKFVAAHVREMRCAPHCEALMREKRSARIVWLTAELAHKEALLERLSYTT